MEEGRCSALIAFKLFDCSGIKCVSVCVCSENEIKLTKVHSQRTLPFFLSVLRALQTSPLRLQEPPKAS